VVERVQRALQRELDPDGLLLRREEAEVRSP
jgi:hypothetical protein